MQQQYQIGKPGYDDDRKWADVKHTLRPEAVRIIERNNYPPSPR